jgi:hypothetical protein
LIQHLRAGQPGGPQRIERDLKRIAEIEVGRGGSVLSPHAHASIDATRRRAANLPVLILFPLWSVRRQPGR